MAKTLQYWGTGNFQEHPYTGRIVTWTEKEKQTVDDAIATKLLAANAGFVLDNDETGEVVTSRIYPVTGGIKLSTGTVMSQLVVGGATCCIIGDSLGYKERRVPSASYYQSISDTLFQQINARLGQKFKLMSMGAADGVTLATILDQFETSVRSYAPDYVWCLGTMENDIFAGTATATLSTQLDTLLAKCRSIGAKLIVTAPTPGGTLITTSAQRDAWYAANRLIVQKFGYLSDVCLLRTDMVLADPTAAYPTPITGGYTDGAWHWYQRGATLLADVFASQISDFVGGVFDPFDGSISTGMTDTNVLTPNMFNTGTTAGGGNLTGTLPGSGVSFSVGGTGSGVSSLVSRLSEGVPGNWCDIAYTGPASPVWNTDRIRGNTGGVSIASAGLAVGDVVQGLWECETTSVTQGLMGIQVFVIFTGSTGTYNRSYGNTQNNGTGATASLLTTKQGKRVLCTPPLAIPVGTTALALYVEAHPTGASAAFTARFGRHAIRKLDSTWY